MKIPKKRLIKEIEEIELALIESRCRPNKLSVSGFISSDDSLIQVISKDEAFLAQFGITFEQIADRLETIVLQVDRQKVLIDRASKDYHAPSVALRNGITVGQFLVSGYSFMGSQECPFYSERANNRILSCGFGSEEYTITNTQSQEKINFSGLHLHLIRDHHFFEGNVPYRLNPVDVINMFGLEKDVDYSPRFAEEVVWEYVGKLDHKHGDTSYQSEISIGRNLLRNNIPSTIIDEVLYKLDNDSGYGIILSFDDKTLKGPVIINGEFVSSVRISEGHTLIKRKIHRYCIT